MKLSDFCSIYTAEAYAIYHALKIIKKKNQMPKSIILSDSLNTIFSIHNTNQPNAISSKMQNLITYLKYNNQIVLLTWIPGHVGFLNN